MSFVRRKNAGFLLGVAAIAVAFLIVQGILTANRSSPYLPKGSPAPDFTFQKFGGGTVSLAELRGKIVLLDFWATWCPPCVAEMPVLIQLAKQYESKGVVFVAANRDDAHEARAAVGRYSARKLPEVAQYTAFADDVTTDKYLVVSLPTLYVIDREGRVAEARSGFATEGQLRSQIEEALQQ